MKCSQVSILTKEVAMADTAQIVHLLRRTEYVARPARVSYLSGLSLEAAVDDILNVPPGDVALPASLTTRNLSQNKQQQAALAQWWLDRMIDAPKPVAEKMAFFWHGHFVTGMTKVNEAFLLARENHLHRSLALGNFRELTQAIAVAPAMLLYLDNADNESGTPNQNFARELMELFTLGVGNYTESDVEAAAAAWTGHGINRTTFNYEFHPLLHDGANKLFMGVSAPWNGPEIINHLLLVNSPTALITARFVVTKLWEYFAYQSPAAYLVEALAVGFANDWNIKALLKALLLRPEFYWLDALQGMVRNPVEWVVAVMYHLGVRSQFAAPDLYLEAMGQDPLDPPNVSGWRPNGYWVNTSTVGARAEFARNTVLSLPPSAILDVSSLTIDTAINLVCSHFDLLPVSSATRQSMEILLTEQRSTQPGLWEGRNLMTLAILCPEMHTV
jgi:uncharacterized protein (DUF1800 family)